MSPFAPFVTVFQSTLPRRERRIIHLAARIHISFNPRSHAGSDYNFAQLFKSIAQVSIHAPTQGATSQGGCCCTAVEVSIHAPTQGATLVDPVRFCPGDLFQSTLPRRERRISGSIRHTCCSFNPRSHAGSDYLHNHFYFSPDVSIHAPTQGATPVTLMERVKHGVSIHAPTQGATITFCKILNNIFCFNPRSHAGSDISRHPRDQVSGARFNPRSHAGSDDGKYRRRAGLQICFNPRSHAGSDGLSPWTWSDMYAVSIHAPTQGATYATWLTNQADRQFQSTLPRRERRQISYRL